MKNQKKVLLCCLLLLGIWACKNDGQNEKKAPEEVTVYVPPVKGPKSIPEIEKLAKSIDAQMDSFSVAGPNYVFQGKERTDVMVYSNDAGPQLIYCKTPKLESWYYLTDRRPFFLKEIALTEDGFTQNRFYYGTKGLLAAETRKGASPEATNTGESSKFRGDKDDFRLSNEAATGKVLEYLYGKMK